MAGRVRLLIDSAPAGGGEVGELLVATAVGAANVVKDLRENLRNLAGGELHHYEDLIDATVERALRRLEDKAASRGYDGIVGLRISHPSVVDGGVEVVVYGNGFSTRREGSAPDAEATRSSG